jgi:hypothetical protein
MSLLTGPPDSTGGCQSALFDKIGVSPSRYHHTMLHITITRDEQYVRRGRSSETSVSLHHKQSTNVNHTKIMSAPTILFSILLKKISEYNIVKIRIKRRNLRIPNIMFAMRLNVVSLSDNFVGILGDYVQTTIFPTSRPYNVEQKSFNFLLIMLMCI